MEASTARDGAESGRREIQPAPYRCGAPHGQALTQGHARAERTTATAKSTESLVTCRSGAFACPRAGASPFVLSAGQKGSVDRARAPFDPGYPTQRLGRSPGTST
jgi:hypothetical protein